MKIQLFMLFHLFCLKLKMMMAVGQSHGVTWTVEVTDSSSNVVATETTNVIGENGEQQIIFATPLKLTKNENWTLKITAQGTSGGNNLVGADSDVFTGLDKIWIDARQEETTWKYWDEQLGTSLLVQ